MKTCNHCHVEKPDSEFRIENGSFRGDCRKCENIKKQITTVGKKLQGIRMLGCRCLICGYSDFYGALEFHHVDPSTKLYGWTELRWFKWFTIERELNKCVLLCSNCHREVENMIYQGKDLTEFLIPGARPPIETPLNEVLDYEKHIKELNETSKSVVSGQITLDDFMAP